MQVKDRQKCHFPQDYTTLSHLLPSTTIELYLKLRTCGNWNMPFKKCRLKYNTTGSFTQKPHWFSATILPIAYIFSGWTQYDCNWLNLQHLLHFVPIVWIHWSWKINRRKWNPNGFSSIAPLRANLLQLSKPQLQPSPLGRPCPLSLLLFHLLAPGPFSFYEVPRLPPSQLYSLPESAAFPLLVVAAQTMCQHPPKLRHTENKKETITTGRKITLML